LVAAAGPGTVSMETLSATDPDNVKK